MQWRLHDLVARHPAARTGAAPSLQGVELNVARAEQVAVIGASGAGKTTLLQVMALAMRPGAGTLSLDDVAPWSLPRRSLQRLRGKLFLAPQVPPLPPRQRVVTAVLAGRLPAMSLLASLRSLLAPTDVALAHEALDRFDMADKLFDRVDRLSGGERQRVGLARALMAPASSWLIDEPLSALDPTRARQALATLVRTAGERQVTLVATLHQVDMALEFFPRIIGLRDGLVAFDLPTAQVTRERLQALYAQRESELAGVMPASGGAGSDGHISTTPPIVVHCR